ncbi:putative FBD-associated F-box protein At5g44940 [Eutrema salsugineum]|uniref:putative FBD-associated F-box protein At5g44940 n=1 Tax=Eutrema salsugineum TaxID=72664 RepID=UPI000CECEAF8|nr:putative FBD-associated F-box protein At5g44940 [Eutrema salsugineum]
MSEIKRDVDFMPKYMYVNDKLNVGLEDPKFVFCLPCLKNMHLGNIYYESDGHLTMQRLLTASTILEDLTMDVPVTKKPKKTLFRKEPWCLSSTLMYLKINKQIMKMVLKNYFS